ncbi:hypothetical protein PLICRDRAFT_614595 [Plicaturopsis crispa FD-325 SS-3]|nr:hypothetical protein PLICRDRAFT_614595 [Plicaturopsis crispa FD-325 SS-3]
MPVCQVHVPTLNSLRSIGPSSRTGSHAESDTLGYAPYVWENLCLELGAYTLTRFALLTLIFPNRGPAGPSPPPATESLKYSVSPVMTFFFCCSSFRANSSSIFSELRVSERQPSQDPCTGRRRTYTDIPSIFFILPAIGGQCDAPPLMLYAKTPTTVGVPLQTAPFHHHGRCNRGSDVLCQQLKFVR